MKKAVFILKAWIGFRSKGGDQFGVSFFQGILDVSKQLLSHLHSVVKQFSLVLL